MTNDSVLRPRRRMLTLASFMCVKVPHGFAGPCVATCGGCGMRDTYERALAYQRCARLLGIIDRWWGTIGLWRRRGEVAKWRRLRRHIRKALRQAGL